MQRTSIFKVAKIPDKGWGVVTIAPIHQGEIVCNYNGDLISVREANNREVPVPLNVYMIMLYVFL